MYVKEAQQNTVKGWQQLFFYIKLPSLTKSIANMKNEKYFSSRRQEPNIS
jgi:hypothetical protein